MKCCSKCKQTQDLKEFHKSTVHKDGLNPQCRSCYNKKRIATNKNRKDMVNERSKQWYINNKSRVRTNQILAKYGLTREQYQILVDNQNNCCAICNGIMNGKREPAIDHCHTTGKVRGLLCNNCNVALGHLKDNIKTLENAIVYLNNSKVVKLVG